MAIIMPDEETCLELSDAYVHAVDIRWDPNRDEDDPFKDFDDIRTELTIVEVRCESATDDS